MLSNLFYRNSRLTILVIGLILVAGLAALQSLARQEDPALARRYGSITTFLPGANALRVESLVTDKIEAELLELHEVKEIDSLSRAGVSSIQVDLEDRYLEEDVDEIWSKVRDRLSDVQAELPAGATAPDLEARSSTAVTLVAGLLWDQPGPPQIDILTRLAEELENRLRNLPGTKETELHGEAEEEIRVTIDPTALAAANLTAAEVSRAIARADAKLPAGQLRGDASDLLIEVAGELTSVGRIGRVPVRQERDGRFLRVADIATVTKTVREPPATLAWLDGVRGVAVTATMEPNRRVDRWAESAHEVMDEFRADVPTGIRFELLFDQSRYTEERLGTLVGNLVAGACIVVLVLLVLMGIRSALIVASALPLTVLAVLAELNALGVPLHQTSITGLIIALGLLIDNAIVVVDDYRALARSGIAPSQAVARAVGHLFVPLLASTLTTVLAFLPIVLMPGGAGEFVGPIAIGVGLSVVTSFLLSMTVIAALAGHLLPTPRNGEAPQHWWHEGFWSPRLEALYRRTIRLALRRPALGVGFSLVLPVLGFWAGSTLVEQFFPPNDRNQFQVQLVLPSRASLEKTHAHLLRAREIVHRNDEVLASHWFAGEAAPRVFYNMIGNQDGVASFAGGFVTTRSAADTERLLPPLQAELVAAFPDARVIAVPFEQGPPYEAPIEVRLLGADLDVLRVLGDEVRALLAETQGVTYTTAKLRGGEPKLLLRADEEEVRLAGLRLGDIADQLNESLEGAVGGSVIEATEEIPVRVRVAAGDRDDLTSLAANRVLSPERGAESSERSVPGVSLDAVSEIALVPDVAGIARRNGQRSNTVQAFLVPYALIAESLADFQQRSAASPFELPAGYRLEFGGEDAERSEAVTNLASFALPLFVVMAGAIILSFNSFMMAGIIFAVAFLSIGLALLGVWIFGHPMGFVAIVGTMGLVGLAINDAIVVLSALRADARARKAELEGTEEVVIRATRHILCTTLTTIGGFTPLILFGGRFWPPMACAIAGGVAGASILALYFVPSVFTWLARREAQRAATSYPRRVAVTAAVGGGS